MSKICLLLIALTLFSNPDSKSIASDEKAPEINVAPSKAVFLAYGDIRFTDPARCDISDARIRKAIVDRMAGEQADFIVIPGDVVYHGDDESDWKVFEQETKPFRDHKLPLYPVLGNHDVHGASGQSTFISHFDELKKFPRLKKEGWYSIDYGNSRFLMLDSQSSYDLTTPQGEWLRSELKSTPDDLDYLFVVLHHPLVTHPARFPFLYSCGGRVPLPNMSHDVEDSEQRLKVVLEKFTGTHPAVKVVVISGHNHNYERYVIKGITYIVSAGGGATPYRVVRHKTDPYQESGPTYHYCKIAIRGHALHFEMYKLTFRRSEPEWQMKDAFDLDRHRNDSSASPDAGSAPQHSGVVGTPEPKQ